MRRSMLSTHPTLTLLRALAPMVAAAFVAGAALAGCSDPAPAAASGASALGGPYTLSVAAPASGANVGGTVTVSGSAPGFVNVEVWDPGHTSPPLARATPQPDGSFSATVDTTALANGADSWTVWGWDVPAGQTANHSASQPLPVTIANGASGRSSGGGSSGGGSSGGGSDGGSPGGGVPGDAKGVTALRIADMMEAFGANIFPNGQDGQAGETLAGITAAAQYLLGDSGLKMLFRGYVDDTAEFASFGPSLFGATGCKFTLCMNIGDSPDPSEVISLAQASVNQGGWIQFIEGGNEPNTDFGAPYQTSVAPDAELAAQQQIYAAVHPLGITVAAPSVVGNYAGIASYWGGDLGGAVAASDVYNSHLYPNNGGPNGANQLHDWSQAVSQSDWGGKGGVITEWQPVLYNNVATDDATCAYWTPILLLSGYADFGLQAMVWWEMFDYSGFNPHVGLFNGTAASPYPAAKVLKAMYALTGDSGSTKHTFTPGKLDVTVSNLPGGANQYAGGRSAVFQSSSGTFFVFVWNEQNALATGSSTPVTVTFNEGPMAQVVDYSLTNPITESPTPVQTLAQVSSVKLDLTTEVRLLQVTHP